jgi:hypothetical protein
MKKSTTGRCPNCGSTDLQPCWKYCSRQCERRYNSRQAARLKAEREGREYIPKIYKDEQPELPTMGKLKPVARPEHGERCACGNVLYHYEHGKCLPCVRKSIIAQREGRILLSDARNLSYYHAAQAGD